MRRTCDHVTFGKLAEIPRGLRGKLSQWQREMTADFRRIVTNQGAAGGKRKKHHGDIKIVILFSFLKADFL